MIREILADRLFLGNATDARNVRLIYDNRIAAVVDLAASEPPAQLPRDIIYCRIPIVDGDGNSNAVIDTAIRCVAALIKNNFRTIVACSAGLSRSPALAAAAMAMFTKSQPDECLTTIAVNAPHDVSPALWSHVKAVYNQIVRSGS